MHCVNICILNCYFIAYKVHLIAESDTDNNYLTDAFDSSFSSSDDESIVSNSDSTGIL
jgi:hypothetical protein